MISHRQLNPNSISVNWSQKYFISLTNFSNSCFSDLNEKTV